MINIAVLGYGTIGSGVVEIVEKNQEVLQKNTRHEVEVKYVLDLRDFPGTTVEHKVVHDFDIIEKDVDVQIIVETMGGIEPACTFAKRALKAGKAYVTSNKELVAKHGAELIALARANNTNFLFEASVGGGIPIIRPLVECITADRVLEISGILNGTTNYILTKMTEEGWSFEDALKDAQKKGYAERNPEADIEGHDPRRKIAILASLAVGQQIDFEDVYTEGISKVTGNDISYAKALGCKIKLLGTYKNVDNNHFAMVVPKLVPFEHPLSSVSGVYNSISVIGNMLGTTMFYGAGAGKLPTASAVISDVVEAANMMNQTIRMFWDEEKLNLTSTDDFEQKVFVRMKDSVDREEIAKVFGEVEVVEADGVTGEYAFVTEVMKEKELKEKVAKFDEILGYLRMA